MRTIATAVTGLAMLLFGVGAVAQPSGNTGFYVGFGMGKSKAAFIKDDFTVTGTFPTVSESTTSRETSYKAYVGYSVSKYIALEGSWTRFGEFKYKYDASSILPNNGKGAAEYSVDSWALTAVGTVPIGSGFSALGRIGGAYNNVIRKAVTGDFFIVGQPDAQAKTSSVVWGLGAQYDAANTVAFRLEYEDYGKVGKANPHPSFPAAVPFPQTGQAKIAALTLSILGRF